MIAANKKRVVVIGGGAGGLELVVRLCQLAKHIPLEITLIDKELKHVWKPLFHEVAAGTFNASNDEINYITYAYQKNFEFVLGPVKEINQESKTIIVGQYQEDTSLPLPDRVIHYDFLILAIGSQANDFNIQGVKEYCLRLDDLDQAEHLHHVLIENFILKTQNKTKEPIKICVVGGGATGVELAAEFNFALANAFKYSKKISSLTDRPFQITLLESSNRLLGGLPSRISKSVSHYLTKNGIEILTDCKVIEVTQHGLETENKGFIESSFIIWSAGVKANGLSFKHHLELNKIDQFVVNDKLQTSDPHIFAFGDCASCLQHDRQGKVYYVPPRAQAAHQQAKILAKSIINLMRGKPLLTYVYKDHGSLISLSRSNVVGTLMGRVVQNFYIEGKLARLTYWLLYKKHLLIVRGVKYVLLSSFVDFLMRKQRPEIKLH